MEDHALQQYAVSLAASGVTAEELATILRDGNTPPKSQVEAVQEPGEAEDESFVRAKAALAADERRTTLVSGAKAILREQLGGHDLGGEWADDELIHMAGLGPKPNETRVEKAQREKQERDAALLADPEALARHRQEQAVMELRRTWWQLSKSQRSEQLDALGITAADWTPPTNFNGLS